MSYENQAWYSNIEMLEKGDYSIKGGGMLSLNSQYPVKILCPSSGKINVNDIRPSPDTLITLATVSSGSVFSQPSSSEKITITCPIVEILSNSNNEADFLTVKYYLPTNYAPLTYGPDKSPDISPKIPKNEVRSIITTSLYSLKYIGVTLTETVSYAGANMSYQRVGYIQACRFIKSDDFTKQQSPDQPWINVVSYNEKGEEIKSGERGYLLFVTEKVDRERVKPFNPFESFSP